MIITVANLKGGTAKTTTAIYLAMCAWEDDDNPVVVDADSEPSALAWSAPGRLPFPVVAGEGDGLVMQVKELASAGHTVIIDGPPNARDALWAAATAANLVLVPIKPTGIDVNRLRSTLKVLMNIEASRPEGLLTRILFTMYERNTVLMREAVELLARFPTLEARVRNLQRYARGFGDEPKYLSEYRQVWQEVRDVVRNS